MNSDAVYDCTVKMARLRIFEKVFSSYNHTYIREGTYLHGRYCWSLQISPLQLLLYQREWNRHTLFCVVRILNEYTLKPFTECFLKAVPRKTQEKEDKNTICLSKSAYKIKEQYSLMPLSICKAAVQNHHVCMSIVRCISFTDLLVYWLFFYFDWQI